MKTSMKNKWNQSTMKKLNKNKYNQSTIKINKKVKNIEQQWKF